MIPVTWGAWAGQGPEGREQCLMGRFQSGSIPVERALGVEVVTSAQQCEHAQCPGLHTVNLTEWFIAGFESLTNLFFNILFFFLL